MTINLNDYIFVSPIYCNGEYKNSSMLERTYHIIRIKKQSDFYSLTIYDSYNCNIIDDNTIITTLNKLKIKFQESELIIFYNDNSEVILKIYQDSVAYCKIYSKNTIKQYFAFTSQFNNLDSYFNINVDFKELNFSATTFSEYTENGIASSGACELNLHIKAIHDSNNKISKLITNISTDLYKKIPTQFELDTITSLNDRVILLILPSKTDVNDVMFNTFRWTNKPTRGEYNFSQNEVAALSIFTEDNIIVKVSLKFIKPNKLIEFGCPKYEFIYHK